MVERVTDRGGITARWKINTKALSTAMPPKAQRHPASSPIKAPKGTPKEIVTALSQAVEKVMQMPDVLAKLKQYDYIPVKISPEEFGQQLQTETDRWKQVVKDTGFKIE